MNTYWIDPMRGFSNEYTLAVASDDMTITLTLMSRGYEHITRAAWIKELRRSNRPESHAGYIASGTLFSRDITMIIADCREATRLYIENRIEGFNIA